MRRGTDQLRLCLTTDFCRVMSAASASLTAAQCHLNEAMELLDPPPPSSLTVAGIAKAYDCLLLPADVSPAFNDSWCALQADIYRGHLLSAHLLLGMAPREQEPDHEKEADHDRKGVNGATVVLTPDDVATLQQTQKRCRLLLFELAMISNEGRQFDGHVTDWHDNILPRSRFQLLRECFELDNSSPDGNKERLVSLDLDSNENDMCHLSACDGIENQGSVTGSESKVDVEVDANDENDDDGDADADIGCIGFDRKLLEREENDLLDIAMPNDSQDPTTKRSPKKGKKRKRTDKANSTVKSGNAKQGCLVLVNDEIISKEKWPYDTPPSSSNRYFVKLQKSGVLCLQLAGNKKAATVQFYLGDKKCKCEPMTLGDTFHFVLKGTQRLDVDATDSRSNSVDRDFELVFKVDEETGGGLAEGFAWVTAITEVSRDSSLHREQQDRIKQEWSVGGEWEAIANQRV